ncbi:MAG TPA: sigma-70 family RNA polymerase sigma factor [Actinomycetota bacterium]|nr:sigma-70 family RNA polymerase sigma factor [Actinomycetota bacterium]
MNAGVQQRGAAEDLGASYASLFRELGAAFRARGLGGEEANDLAQESLVRTFVHLKRHGRTQEDLRPLAHTIARRLYAERGRRLRPRFVELPEAEHLADPTPEPIEQVVASEERADVHAALKELTPRHRRVVSLWMSGLRPAEIAHELGIKRNAADALLHRARRQLAMKLDPSHATLGLFGIAMLRVRSVFRRAVDAVSSFDPSGSIAQATTGLAVVGIGAVLMIATPSATDSRPVGPTDAVATRVASVEGAPATADGTVVSRARDPVDAPRYIYRMRRTATVRDPITNQDNEWFLDIEHTPGNGAVDLDPVLTAVEGLACNSMAACTKAP